MTDYIPKPGEAINPGALRTIAGWLDLYDQLAAQHWDLLEKVGLYTADQLVMVRAACARKETQDDLRRWATDMEGADPGPIGVSDKYPPGFLRRAWRKLR